MSKSWSNHEALHSELVVSRAESEWFTFIPRMHSIDPRALETVECRCNPIPCVFSQGLIVLL